MRTVLTSAFLLLALLGVGGSAQAAMPIDAAPVDEEGTPTLAPIIERATPAIVNISTRSRIEPQQNPLFNDPFFRRFFDIPEAPQPRESTSLGSGVIVNAEEGHIITNNHVIAKATEITVTLNDNREYTAEVVGTDARTDIALLKIEADDLVEIEYADSSRTRVGDFVIAIGNPFGLAHTVTSGIVSAVGRGGLNSENIEDFIQTDASINPGNSGGALIDLKGRLVGVNTAILSRSGGNIGIGFAIPSYMVQAVVQQLLEFGEVKRGTLGVHVQNVTTDIARALGVERNGGALIASVVPGSAAEKAGLEAGDLIVAVNGDRLERFSDLRNMIGLMRVGEEVKIEIIRNGERIVKTATIQDPDARPTDIAQIHPALRGARFGELDERSPHFGRLKGVLVQDVERGSAAWHAGGVGLRPGDVITSVNRQEVATMEEFRRHVSGTEGLLLLNIRRGNSALFIAVR